MAASMAHSSLSVLLLLTLTTSLSISAFMAAHVGDEAALLAFKAAAISGGYDDTLASWNGSAGGYCSWEGVRCRGRHQRVVALSLPSRKLTGVLSPAVGNLSSLRSLDLSFNGFTGNIPASLGRLRRLHILDLKYNNFSGEFPVNLTFCSNLKIIDLLSNQLHGRVPTEIGDKLVGLLVLRLRNNYLTNSIPASLGNLSSVRTLSLSFNQLDGNIPPSIGDIPGILSLDLAYNNLSATKLNRESLSNPSNSQIGRHSDLRKYPLSHRQSRWPSDDQCGRPALRNILSLAQRLDIAVDIMDALDYLHNHCQPPIIHCDVKPSNILLAEDLSARLGDFGISRILPEKANQSLQNSNSTIGIRGSIGYVAPEYGEGSPISTLGDIYSLGILLLEMFTGMRPTNNMFRGSLDLHRFFSIHVLVQKCLVSVIDISTSCLRKQPR
ncbi:hypothetical protein PR202_gb26421 [Eleusine coracana subsp. coracana]|uniref:Protein kinase domain-containing protein n=1 Tax=Eleusine coracana subsp. coracana TaxID=191504 RepID=A0AAV5FRT3_ELECO|nr:hypothetical protein PR202_gb26421 [Eleusine coracana subsp. coracana]